MGEQARLRPRQQTASLDVRYKLPGQLSHHTRNLFKGKKSRSAEEVRFQRRRTNRLLHKQSMGEKITRYPTTVVGKGIVKGISKYNAVVMCVNLYVGLGLFIMPQVFAYGGWLASFLTIIMGYVALTAAQQLIMCFNVCGAENYSDVGQAAMGCVGKYVVKVFLTIVFVVMMWYYIIVLFDFMELIYPASGWYYLLVVYAITIPMILLQTYRPSAMQYLHLAGSAIIIYLVGACIALAIVAIVDPAFMGGDVAPTTTWKVNNVMMMFTSLVFQYGGAGFLPGIYRDMEQPGAEINYVTTASFAIMAVLYVIVGAVSYGALGEKALQSNSNVWSCFLAYSTYGRPYIISCVAFLMFKLSITNVGILGVTLEYLEPALFPPDASHRMAKTMALRVITFMFIAFLVVFSTAYDNVVASFWGPVFVMAETYWFPSVFFAILMWRNVDYSASRSGPDTMLARFCPSRRSFGTTVLHGLDPATNEEVLIEVQIGKWSYCAYVLFAVITVAVAVMLFVLAILDQVHAAAA